MASELFEDFWENTKLNKITIQHFSETINKYYSLEKNHEQLQYPGRDYVLKRPKDGLQSILQARQSSLKFGKKPLSEKQLGFLCAAFAEHGSHRSFPAAGGIYTTEIFALLHNINGPLNGKIVYYNVDDHSLSIVTEIPSDLDYMFLTNLQVEHLPAVTFLFVSFASRSLLKYGQRGGRFILIEAGHAMQNLALRIGHQKLAGVQIGGLLDDEVMRLLQLEKYDAQVLLGYAVGTRRT